MAKGSISEGKRRRFALYGIGAVGLDLSYGMFYSFLSY